MSCLSRSWPWPTLAFACALGCGGESEGEPRANAACEPLDALAVLSDYSSSFVGALGPSAVAVRAAAELGTDPVLRLSAGRAFALNRADGVAFEIHPQCGHGLARTLLSPAQKVWNPQDLAVASDGSLWVPMFNVPTLRVLPAGGEDGDADVLDLSLAAHDEDGNPNAASVVGHRVDGREKMFVALELLDNTQRDLPPKGPARLLRFDVERRQMDASYNLLSHNPFGHTVVDSDLFYYASAGSFDAAAEAFAGVEVFDPARGHSRLLIRETDLDGSVAEVAVHRGCGAAIVAGPERDVNPTELWLFDAPRHAGELDALPARAWSPGLLGPTAGYDLQGLAWVGDQLYVGDRRRAGAGYLVHRFVRDPAQPGCNLRADGTLTVPQKPVSLRPTVRP